MKPTCTSRRPADASASATTSAASPVGASGFSHSTGLPSARQASTKSAWVASEETTTTASTSAARMSSSGSAIARPPAEAAAASARTRSASETAATSAPSTSAASVRAWEAPMTPAPMTPMRSATASDRRREVHVAAVVGGVLRLLRPARGDRLAARVEAHALRPVDVVVAEQRVLPAAEGVERHRHRDRHVDADHPYLHAAREHPRRLAGAREDRGPVGERAGVDERDRLLERVHAHHAQHGAEDLVRVDRHVGADVVEER